MATHIGIPVAAVRVLFAVFTVNGIGLFAYIGLWLLVPDELMIDLIRERIKRLRESLR